MALSPFDLFTFDYRRVFQVTVAEGDGWLTVPVGGGNGHNASVFRISDVAASDPLVALFVLNGTQIPPGVPAPGAVVEVRFNFLAGGSTFPSKWLGHVYVYCQLTDGTIFALVENTETGEWVLAIPAELTLVCGNTWQGTALAVAAAAIAGTGPLALAAVHPRERLNRKKHLRGAR